MLICAKTLSNDEISRSLAARKDCLKPAGKLVIVQNGWGNDIPYLRYFPKETVYSCREEAAALFHMTQPENVVFTMNATHALNIAVHSLVQSGMRVAVSGFEHNAVMRPLYASGASILTSDTPLFDSAALVDWFERHLPECDAAVCTCVSNVFGFILPVREIAALCRRHDVPLIVDASQSAGILDLDFPRLGAAFAAMPGHKGLLGPQGTGILLCRDTGMPLLSGGTGGDSPAAPSRSESASQLMFSGTTESTPVWSFLSE